MIRIVGTGPGGRDYMTAEATRLIRNSRVVIGGKRVLDELGIPEGARIELPDYLTGSVIDILEREEANGGATLAVSGDPGFYSLARRVVLHFGGERVSVTPGISSVQLMAARLCRSWAGIATAALHGRSRPDLAELASKLESSAALAVLLGLPEDAASDVEWLSERRELASAWAAIGWDLGLPGEQVIESRRLDELCGCRYTGRLGLLWLEKQGT